MRAEDYARVKAGAIQATSLPVAGSHQLPDDPPPPERPPPPEKPPDEPPPELQELPELPEEKVNPPIDALPLVFKSAFAFLYHSELFRNNFAPG